MSTHRADPRPNHIPSQSFRASSGNGGFVFRVQVSPYGEAENEDAEYVSAFLKLCGPGEEKVTATAGFTFCLINADRSRDLIREVISHDFSTLDGTTQLRSDSISPRLVSCTHPRRLCFLVLEFAGTWGWPKFIKREELATAGFLQNDTLSIDCDVRLGDTSNPASDSEPTFAPQLMRDLRVMWKDNLHTDVIIRPNPNVTANSSGTNSGLSTPVKLPAAAAAGTSTSAGAAAGGGGGGGGGTISPATTSRANGTLSPLVGLSSIGAGGTSVVAAASAAYAAAAGTSTAPAVAGGSMSTSALSLDSSLDRHAHKGILAARSPVFRAMFSAGFKESKESVIDMNYSPVVCDAFLEYIYTGGMMIRSRARGECSHPPPPRILTVCVLVLFRCQTLC